MSPFFTGAIRLAPGLISSLSKCNDCMVKEAVLQPPRVDGYWSIPCTTSSLQYHRDHCPALLFKGSITVITRSIMSGLMVQIMYVWLKAYHYIASMRTASHTTPSSTTTIYQTQGCLDGAYGLWPFNWHSILPAPGDNWQLHDKEDDRTGWVCWDVPLEPSRSTSLSCLFILQSWDVVLCSIGIAV